MPVVDRALKKYFWIGVVFTAATALFIQIVLLPHLLPHLHAGNGLLVGGDWLGFHQMAASQAERVLLFGWNEWQLRPSGHAQVGILSALYVVLKPAPWVLIPLNALLHAASATLLASMLRMITGRIWISILATLPFLLFPSAATWYAQIHKDGFYIFGYFLCLYGWMTLCNSTDAKGTQKLSFSGFFCILSGALMVALVRDWGVKLLVLMGCVFVFGMTLRLFAMNRLRLWRKATLTIFILLSIPWLTNEYSGNHYFDAVKITEHRTAPPQSEANPAQWAPLSAIWKKSSNLPDRIDAQLAAVSQVRREFLLGSVGASSAIDPEVRFRDAGDFFKYLPRALQVGLLAPFPSDWLAQGRIPASTIMRRISAAEMLITYVSLCFVPYLLFRSRRSLNIWLFLMVNLLILLLYAYVVPNVGTLYRLRYGALMPLVAMGVAGAAYAFEDLRARWSNCAGPPLTKLGLLRSKTSSTKSSGGYNQ